MKIIHFNLYRRNFNISSSSIITVHKQDIKFLKKFLKKYKIMPYKVYVLFNYPKEFEGLVAYYLKHKYYKYYEIDNSLEILIIWDTFLEHFNKNHFNSIFKLLYQIKSIDLLLDLEPLKNDLYTIINAVQIPFYEEGLFLKKSFNKKKINRNDYCFEDYYSIRDKLNTLDGISNLVDVNMYIDKIKRLLPVHTGTLEDKYFFISIYFYNIASYHYKNKNYTVSYNMLHRTLDLYFEYLCEIENLASSHKFLWNKYEDLAANSSYTFSTSESNMITKLNKSRNKLYLTHGLYSIRKNELKKMLSDIRGLINSKSGLLWSNRLKELEFNFKLKPLDIFRNEPSFSTYFKDITNDMNF